MSITIIILKNKIVRRKKKRMKEYFNKSHGSVMKNKYKNKSGN